MQQRNIVFSAIGGVLLVIGSMIGAGGSCVAADRKNRAGSRIEAT